MTLIVCPSKLVYHIPCPGCGVTRASLLMLKGHIIDGIMINPNCLLAIAYLYTYPIILLFSVINGKSYIERIYQLMNEIFKKKTFLYTFLIIELIIWLHNMVAGT